MHQIKAERYIIPEQKRVRVIIDSDANCECDDQYAIVHALLTPKVQVMGLIAEQYGEPDSMEQSFQELWRICRRGDSTLRSSTGGYRGPFPLKVKAGGAWIR